MGPFGLCSGVFSAGVSSPCTPSCTPTRPPLLSSKSARARFSSARRLQSHAALQSDLRNCLGRSPPCVKGNRNPCPPPDMATPARSPRLDAGGPPHHSPSLLGFAVPAPPGGAFGNGDAGAGAGAGAGAERRGSISASANGGPPSASSPNNAALFPASSAMTGFTGITTFRSASPISAVSGNVQPRALSLSLSLKVIFVFTSH